MQGTFLNELLPRYYENTNRLNKWLPTIFDRIVSIAIRSECHNVSGFYRLLTLFVKSSNFTVGNTITIQCREILRPFLVGIHQRVSSLQYEIIILIIVYYKLIPPTHTHIFPF